MVGQYLSDGGRGSEVVDSEEPELPGVDSVQPQPDLRRREVTGCGRENRG